MGLEISGGAEPGARAAIRLLRRRNLTGRQTGLADPIKETNYLPSAFRSSVRAESTSFGV